MTITDFQNRRLDAITGLRFIAASMIVAHHARALNIPVPDYSLDHGVSFFFVLSGFILCYAYPELTTRMQAARFLVARIARIWPAHVVGLLFAIAAVQLPIDPTFVANLFLIHGWIPSWPWYFSYNAPSWSISTELFFYLCFPLLILNWQKTWWWKWLLSAALLAGAIALGAWAGLPDVSPDDRPTLHGLLYVNPIARLFEFVTGMVTCSAFRLVQPYARKLPALLPTTMEALVVILCAYSLSSHLAISVSVAYISPIAFQWFMHTSNVLIFPFVILVFAHGAGALSSVLGSRPMVVLGEMSYSVYLLHATVFALVLRSHREPLTSPDYVGLAVAVALTLAMSYVVWRHIEIPARWAAKRWAATALVDRKIA